MTIGYTMHTIHALETRGSFPPVSPAH